MEDDRIEKYCKYCEEAKTLSDPDTMLCPFRGDISASYVCGKFKYDPLKREPKRPKAKIPSEEEIEF